MIRSRMTNGIVRFDNVQIFDYADTGVCELIKANNELIPIELGKNGNRVLHLVTVPESVLITSKRSGVFFYLWSKPLTNYYHCILDGIGCVHRYFTLKEQYPDITLLINGKPRMGLAKYPPFVEEMLDLLGVKYEYTDPNIEYETVYFGDTLNQDQRGKRIQPDPIQWQYIDKLVRQSLSSVTMPKYEKIYISRRAHANPMNDRKSVIGEDNTVKRGLTNEDEVVEILKDLGYTEVFGENYTLAEKIAMFSQMEKYISTAGAGVTNMLFVRDHPVSVGGIHTPGFPFPGHNHERHICSHRPYCKATINIYPGKVVFEDPQPKKGYNHPWRINNLVAFRKWAETI